MGGLRSIVQIRSHAQKYFKKVKETLVRLVMTNWFLFFGGGGFNFVCTLQYLS